MALPLLLPLIGMGVSAIGTGIQAFQNAQANRLAEENYNKQRGLLLEDKYANPLDSVANKALLTQMDRRLDKQEERIQNQATAGGATFENVLAAKQASNEAVADVVSSVMQNEQARQDNLRNQLLNIDSQRTAQQMQAKMASGANWAGLANNLSSGLTDLGGVMVENKLKFRDLFKA